MPSKAQPMTCFYDFFGAVHDRHLSSTHMSPPSNCAIIAPQNYVFSGRRVQTDSRYTGGCVLRGARARPVYWNRVRLELPRSGRGEYAIPSSTFLMREHVVSGENLQENLQLHTALVLVCRRSHDSSVSEAGTSQIRLKRFTPFAWVQLVWE